MMLLLLLACGGSEPVDTADTDAAVDPDALFPPPAEGEGFRMGIDVEAPPSTEIWKCLITTLDTTELSAVNRVASRQIPGIHHMDIMALGLVPVEIEPGTYDCRTLYDAHPELMEQGIFLYASQLEEESLELPDGVAAMVPAALQVMVEIHYVNTTPDPVQVWSRVNAYTTDPADVTESIWGSAVRDTNLNIPAQSTHTEWTRCVMNEDIDLLFLSSHTHQLAERFEVYAFDGVNTGELIYENDDWHAPQLMKFTPQLHIPAGTGFEFRCLYENDGDTEVHWGFAASDEMCQIGIVHTPSSMTAACEVVETSDGLGVE